MRWLLPLLLACCATGCGACVDEPDPPAAQGSASTAPRNLPMLGAPRPHVMRFGQGVDDGGIQRAGDTE